MFKIKLTSLISAGLLLMSMFSFAGAQTKKSPAFRMPPVPPVGVLSGSYELSVSASQVSAGDVDFASGNTFGWTWSGTTSGYLSGYMFMSLNYSAAPIQVGADLSEMRIVTGGSWSKVVFIDGIYAGRISGKIVNGSVMIDGKSMTSMDLELVGDSGTDTLVGSTGTGRFSGVIDNSDKTSHVWHADTQLLSHLQRTK
jgi:hypothetical protein